MRLLVDHEISAAVQNPAANLAALAYVLEGDPIQRRQIDTAQIHSATLDLTIGEIFIPGSPQNNVGGSDHGKNEHSLAQGHTAVVKTRERVHMSGRQAGIAFPPARMSLNGLLMTNPGHIDPGYDGPLHCTVINMGHESYVLRRGDRIIRVLFFELDQIAQANPTNLLPAVPNPISTELLGRLSVDFVDVKKRAKKIANAAVRKAALIAAIIPIIVALVTILGPAFFPPLQKAQDDILNLRSDLGATITKLDEKADIYRLENELKSLQVQVRDDSFNERLKALENKVGTLSPGSPGDIKR
jgi:dCTP deaminase